MSKVRREKLLEFIDDFWATQFRAPTIRDIIAGTDFTSTSVVAYNLRELFAQGKLARARVKKGSATPYMPLWVLKAIAVAGRVRTQGGLHTLAQSVDVSTVVH